MSNVRPDPVALHPGYLLILELVGPIVQRIASHETTPGGLRRAPNLSYGIRAEEI